MALQLHEGLAKLKIGGCCYTPSTAIDQFDPSQEVKSSGELPCSRTQGTALIALAIFALAGGICLGTALGLKYSRHRISNTAFRVGVGSGAAILGCAALLTIAVLFASITSCRSKP